MTLSQPHIRDFTVATTSSQEHLLDMQIARYIYACNDVADMPEFKTMISLLRPGYTAPNRKKLANNLLDAVFEEVNQKTSTELKDKEVRLIQDGWSDIHNTPVIASCVHSGYTLTLNRLHITIFLNCFLVCQNMKIPACYALCLMYNAASQLLGIWCIDLCVDLIALLTIF